MEPLQSTFDSAALGRARALLKPPLNKDSLWPPTMAAGLAAFCALALAATVIMVPPVISSSGAAHGLRPAVHERSGT